MIATQIGIYEIGYSDKYYSPAQVSESLFRFLVYLKQYNNFPFQAVLKAHNSNSELSEYMVWITTTMPVYKITSGSWESTYTYTLQIGGTWAKKLEINGSFPLEYTE